MPYFDENGKGPNPPSLFPKREGGEVIHPPAFHVMVKPRGAVCNLACDYCFYLQKEQLYPSGSFRMSDVLLEAFTRQYIEAQQTPEITFAWQGGEPTLMGLDFFRRAVELQDKYRRPGARILNALQTNGTLLNKEWAHFLHEHEFLVGLSLDGPRPLHDAYRKDKGSRPTFDRVMAGLNLLKEHQVEYNLLACVNSVTARHPLEVYHFFRDEVGAQFIQFIPIVEKDEPKAAEKGRPLTDRTVARRAYGKFLNTIFDEWVQHDVGKVYVQIFDVALGIWAGYPASLCVFADTCGLALALEHNGDLYACDHFVDPPYLLGNILEKPLGELVGSEKQRRFGLDKHDALPAYCRRCPVEFVCHGACPKDRLIETPDGKPGLNYLCESYKSFFTHIDGPMRSMANLLRQGRAPAEIMGLIKSQKS